MAYLFFGMRLTAAGDEIIQIIIISTTVRDDEDDWQDMPKKLAPLPLSTNSFILQSEL